MIRKRWSLAPKYPEQVGRELDDFHPAIRQVLFNRGFRTRRDARDFVRARTGVDTDPFLLLDMEKATGRIMEAIRAGQRIGVFGDYDADGVTATALMMQTLTALGADALPYIPNRFREGYGLNKPALSALAAGGIGLVITVDCGIRALEQVRHARSIGLDLIITDHHDPGEELPEAYAVINPKRAGDPYPDKHLAGVGTAFKLASALIERMRPDSISIEDLHDLVALGTIADLVPLIGENRSLVQQGLRLMRRPQRQGLMSLMGVAGIRPAKLKANNIGFSLGPRINAAGRLESALAAFELLISTDIRHCAQLAQQLDNINRKRQELTNGMQAMAEEIALEAGRDPFLLFASHPEFSPGVVGLAAARLTEEHYRPAVVAHQGKNETRASCRSIPEFHITEALDRCQDLLLKHGGHAAAAGFTAANGDLPELVSRLQSIAEKELAERDLRPVLEIDSEVQLTDLNFEVLKQLKWLEPTGTGNPEPLFAARRLSVVEARQVGRDLSHLKLRVSDGITQMEAIAFRQGQWFNRLPAQVDLAFRFELNEFNGRQTPQLNVEDIQDSG